MARPLFSIITVAKNAGQVIGGTLESVVAQSFEDFEYLIVDGASNDDTLAIAKRYHLPMMRITSETDRGISHAMNKGFQLSSGDLIMFLNAGDMFAGPEVLAKVATDYLASGWEWAIGSHDTLDVHRGVVYERRIRAFNFEGLRRANFIRHESTFVARTLFQKFGLFDEAFKIAMDYDFWLRIGRSVTPRILPFAVARVLSGGISSHETRRYWEYCRARTKNRKGAADAVLFEARHFALHCALNVSSMLAGVRSYRAMKRNRVYAFLRKAALGPYLHFDSMVTTTVRKRD